MLFGQTISRKLYRTSSYMSHTTSALVLSSLGKAREPSSSNLIGHPSNARLGGSSLASREYVTLMHAPCQNVL